MKYVITNGRSAFKHFLHKQTDAKYQPENYVYFHSIDQVRGFRSIEVVLCDGFEARKELLNDLEQYRSYYNEVFYEYCTLN